MSHKVSSEKGHTALFFVTLLAGLALIVLALAFARSNPTLAWVGGIGAAVLFISQFAMVHAEFGKIYARIEALEEKVQGH